MRLILVRHGIAEERDHFAQSGQDDSLRPLVPKGRKRVQALSELLKNWVLDLDLIVSSPYVRAHQTAEILKGAFSEAPMLDAPELAPMIHPQNFVKWLRMNGGKKRSVIAVGHEPHLGLLTSYLLNGTLTHLIEIKKGGVVAFELDSWENLGPESAHLIWLIPPKLFLNSY